MFFTEVCVSGSCVPFKWFLQARPHTNEIPSGDFTHFPGELTASISFAFRLTAKRHLKESFVPVDKGAGDGSKSGWEEDENKCYVVTSPRSRHTDDVREV